MRFWRSCGGAWVSLLRTHFNRHHPGKFSLFNASRWGADSRWALRQMKPRVLAHRADVIILEFAINDADVRNYISVHESEKNIENMIDMAMECKASCDIWLLTSHVPRGRHSKVRPALADYYAMYESVAKRRSVGLIDLHRRWGRTPPDKKYMPDGIHTNILAAKEVILPSILLQLGL